MAKIHINCTIDGLLDIPAHFFAECLCTHYAAMYPDCDVSVGMVHALRSSLTYTNDEDENESRTDRDLEDELHDNINDVFADVCRGKYGDILAEPTTLTKAQLVAQEDAESYLSDCDFEGVDPDSNVSAFGGWDGWAIEGVGHCAFAESITDIDPDEIEELYEACTLTDDQRYRRAAGEYDTKFAEAVEEAISKQESK